MLIVFVFWQFYDHYNVDNGLFSSHLQTFLILSFTFKNWIKGTACYVNLKTLFMGEFFFFFAVYLYKIGFIKDTDYLRWKHGLCHLSFATSSYFLLQTKERHRVSFYNFIVFWTKSSRKEIGI